MTAAPLSPSPFRPLTPQVEQLYSALWETTTDAVLILDVDCTVVSANPASREVLGYAPEALVGQNLAILQPPHYREAHRRAMRRYLESGIRTLDWRAIEMVAVHADGRDVPVDISFADFEIEGRRLFVGFFRDISPRKRAEDALSDERGRAQTTLRSIADGVVTTDAAGTITFLNAAAEQLSGWRHEDALGRSCSDVLQLVEEDSTTTLALVARAVEDHATLQLGDCTLLVRRDGEVFSIEGSVAPLTDRSERPSGAVIAFRDVSPSRRMAAEISYQARHDPLTGLVNRTEFNRRLRAALRSASQDGSCHSLLYLDMDQFKVVNDTCGHTAGDELLRQVATVLKATLRKRDVLARLGGDEFGVLLEDSAPEVSRATADALRRAASDLAFSWKDKRFPVAVSIGQVDFRDASMTPIEILSTADAACYVAKDRGRNRVHIYQPQDEAIVRRHGEMEWIGRINRALEEDRLLLHAQPIYSLQDGQILHHEVLLRLRDTDGSTVMPMAFIPAAERYGLMPTLDRWVIRTVLARIAREGEAGNRVYAINLSGASLADESLAADVREAFERSGVDPARICFELTETAAIGNLAHASALMVELKALGCAFALDDFGSGMSSFAYLKHLPVDFLKIDGGFVRDLLVDPIDQAMVEAINHIGHVMGLRTIAEFAEDERIVSRLREIGVDYAQGYALARPTLLE
ncbi:EAL domain-containing protein [Luteimonas terrae]|uniref:Diguanylate cyclase (GGDEF)-like protein/PAS domain S-box-containing protein n=1 Tax=Luteimonas terrae TaxID=1530191 RepID=A0ABU1XVS8_9GAMM|nr:EAL domain-containing protein [Luteimonas terrae]MDR7192852.1 diguanylate cyclase (GGDEF)-like protein/PAS domain S-box-containing protein [Luteimonas terrae]